MESTLVPRKPTRSIPAVPDPPGRMLPPGLWPFSATPLFFMDPCGEGLSLLPTRPGKRLETKARLWDRGRAEVPAISLFNRQRPRGLIELNDLRISPRPQGRCLVLDACDLILLFGARCSGRGGLLLPVLPPIPSTFLENSPFSRAVKRCFPLSCFFCKRSPGCPDFCGAQALLPARRGSSQPRDHMRRALRPPAPLICSAISPADCSISNNWKTELWP